MKLLPVVYNNFKRNSSSALKVSSLAVSLGVTAFAPLTFADDAANAEAAIEVEVEVEVEANKTSPSMSPERVSKLLEGFVLVDVPVEVASKDLPQGGYYIAKTEVTQALFEEVAGYNPSYFPCTDCPVNNVSGYNMQAFIKKLNAQSGYEFHLPTKFEWDYAAKGGQHSKGYRYSGSNSLADVAWFMGNAERTVHPVAQKAANELGLYDMTGNVSELCSDSMADSKGSISLIALRGGSFDYAEKESLLSYNDGISMNLRLPDVGFRLALKKVEK